LSGLNTQVFDALEKKKFFYCPVEMEVETKFVPQLLELIQPHLSLVTIARQMTDGQ
jgi:hypothetical protein